MKSYKHPIIQRNYLSFLNQTNNLVYYAADFIPIDHKLRKLTTEVKQGLGLPEHLNNFYEYQIGTGYGYSRLQYLTITSICSDTEFLLKDICENFFKPQIKRPKNYFQKLDIVNSENFIPRGKDLNQFSEFNTLKLGFQIRHISIHNMGFVDVAFNKNTGMTLPIDQPFPMTAEIMRQHTGAFQSFIDKLDNIL